MKKFSSTFLSIISFGFLLSCRSKVSFPTVESGKSLLWEISGKGMKQPSYFLGTMHLMCAEDAVLSENVIALIKKTDQVYLEVDMDNASELLTGFLELSSHKNKSLQDVLITEEYNRIRTFFEKFSSTIPFSVMEKQPPLLLSSAVYELMLPCEQKNGVEMKIIDEAYRQKKETKGLESISFQASIFDSIPYEEQARDLLNAVDSLEKNRLMMDEMMKVYRQQDVEKLNEMSMSEDSSMTAHADLLLYSRNRNWVEQFPALASKRSILFAVGAAHLGGEKGVLNLLRKQGYTVRPVKN